MSYDTFLFRIALSLLLGFLIGLERQLTGHPAGIRINVLICMGTCFFTLFPMVYGSAEVFRVGSAIISGVGFLCSGVIFKEKGSVRGMNTAATLWSSAAIGILSTADHAIWSIMATGVLILSNLVFRPLAKKITALGFDEGQEREYQDSVICLDPAEPEIRQLIIDSNLRKALSLRNLESGDVLGGKTEVIAEFYSGGKPKNHLIESMVTSILRNPNVVSAGWKVV